MSACVLKRSVIRKGYFLKKKGAEPPPSISYRARRNVVYVFFNQCPAATHFWSGPNAPYDENYGPPIFNNFFSSFSLSLSDSLKAT